MLAVSLAEPSWLETIGNYAWMILGVGAGLTFVIFVHELGHFLVAKACGVKCEKFYVGFDFFEIPIPFTRLKIPRSLIKFQWGETEYGLGSLPLGGYVKMLGQDDDPRNAEKEAARTRLPQESSDKARAQAIASGVAAEGLVSGQTVEKGTQEAMATHSDAEAKPGEPAVVARTTEGDKILLDPRSYPAKSVPARMAIISAGVIMNLIFGVILGIIAYKLGVNETPAIIGGTTPGSVPWSLGVEPGSKTIQIGKGGSHYEYLRWEDFRFAAILNEGQDVPVTVRTPGGEIKTYNFRSTKNAETGMPMLGLAGPRDRQVNIFPEFAAHLNPQSNPPLEDYDVIVEAAGEEVTSGEDLQAIFAREPLGNLAIKVERPAPEDRKKRRWEWKHPHKTLSAVLSPRPIRELGLAMKIGPILAIRENSPAMQAGLLVGDQIVQIDGAPVGDPLSLSQRLTPASSTPSEVSIVVERKDRGGKTIQKTLQVVPEMPLQSLMLMGTNPISIESIGVAFDVTDEVAAVDPKGPALKAGLQKGDLVTLVEFVPGVDSGVVTKLESVTGNPFIFEEIDLEKEGAAWPRVVTRLQGLFPQTKVKLTWLRGGKKMTAEVQPQDAAEFFDDTRGVNLYPMEITHIAADWSEASQLGFREIKERLFQTLLILQRLVTGRLSPTNLSGPAGIIFAAGSFASEGLPSLLMFLVLLSANLAILNFLPIPALDGGHMLFLAAEAIRGKPVDERLQVRLTVLGVICLLSLMVFATAMDIGRFAQMIQRWFG
jgi:regulator of sigma E protease